MTLSPQHLPIDISLAFIVRHMTCVTKQARRKETTTRLSVLSHFPCSWTPLTLVCCVSSPSLYPARVPAVTSCTFLTSRYLLQLTFNLLFVVLWGISVPSLCLHVSLLLFLFSHRLYSCDSVICWHRPPFIAVSFLPLPCHPPSPPLSWYSL